MYYCYVCNQPMPGTIYVCSHHQSDPNTRAAYLHILTYCLSRLFPRTSPHDSIGEIGPMFGISHDTDLTMDMGL